jgi:hypothetical protein
MRDFQGTRGLELLFRMRGAQKALRSARFLFAYDSYRMAIPGQRAVPDSGGG